MEEQAENLPTLLPRGIFPWKKLLAFIFVLLVLGTIAPQLSVARAFEVKSGDSITVPKETTIDGNLYAAGRDIDIAGVVEGDIICGAVNVRISGIVEGDVICGAQNVTISGRVDGDVRLVAQAINITGSVGRNATLFATRVTLGEDSRIGREVLIFGDILTASGHVGTDLHGGLKTASLLGRVGRNVQLKVDNLTVGPKATISGDLDYESSNEATVDDKATIGGEIIRKDPPVGKGLTTINWPVQGNWFISRLVSMIGLGLIAFLLVGVWPRGVKKTIKIMLDKPGPSFGWGLLALFVAPFILLFLFLTIIGIPLAIILGLLWVAVLSGSRVFVAVLVGQRLLENFWQNKKESLIWAAVIGIVVTVFAFGLPVIGWGLSFGATLWGLGGLLQTLQLERAKKK